MTWQAWTTFAILETVLCFTPGPAVLLVLSQALSRGTGKAVFSIFGIMAANNVYFILSATGIGAILMASYDLFFAIKWIGVGYLVWLGLNEIFGTPKLTVVRPAEDTRADARRMFMKGFILQMSNPKALVFFTALLPQFLNPHAPLAIQVVILASTTMVIEFTGQVLYASLAGRFSHLATRPSFAKLTSRVAGSLLIAAGLGMAAIKRQ